MDVSTNPPPQAKDVDIVPQEDVMDDHCLAMDGKLEDAAFEDEIHVSRVGDAVALVEPVDMKKDELVQLEDNSNPLHCVSAAADNGKDMLDGDFSNASGGESSMTPNRNNEQTAPPPNEEQTTTPPNNEEQTTPTPNNEEQTTPTPNNEEQTTPPPNNDAPPHNPQPAADNQYYNTPNRQLDAAREEDETTPLLLTDISEDDMMVQLNQYQVLCEIGHGAQGTVYKVEDMETGELFALKSIQDASLTDDHDDDSTLRNEIAIMKLMDHPNLVRLQDVIISPETDTLFLVMDYVDGGPVMDDEEIMDGEAQPIDEETAKSYFCELLAGLDYLHHNGVLHRDIKPGNLLKSTSDEGKTHLKICDFGISSFCSSHKSAKLLGEDDVVFVGVSGTLAMLPPEGVGAGPDHVYHGRPADVWAAGVTLYCMLYGCLPFSALDRGDLTHQIITDKVKFPARPSVSESCKKLILAMLNKDPQKRITVSGIMDSTWVNSTHSSYLKRLLADRTTGQVLTPTLSQVRGSISVVEICQRARNIPENALRKASSQLTRISNNFPISRNRREVSAEEPDSLWSYFETVFQCCTGTKR